MEGRRNTLTLAVCWGLFISAISVDLTFDTLVGNELAPSRNLVTLPFALMTVSAAVVTMLASYLMRRIGRRYGFVIGAGIGALGGALSVWSVLNSDFVTFCIGCSLVGVFQAFAQYYRLAAVDSVPFNAQGKAISTVLAGGVLAAVLGPQLASWSKDVLSQEMFAGAYLVVTLLSLLSVAILLLLYRDTEVHERPAVDEDEDEPRPTAAILRQPSFVAAVASIVAGSAVMMFIMTAAPLATVHAHHSVDDGAHVISWHLVGMYAPSLVAGGLIDRVGLPPILIAGTVLSAVCGATAISSETLPAFYVALAILGVGWNFMFVGGTALLTQSYRPSERAKAQGLSELLRWVVTALAILGAGPVLTHYGWTTVNVVAMPLLAAALAAILYWTVSDRRVSRPAAALARAGAQEER